MLHGAYDPHPGRMIHANLRQYMPQHEYREYSRCGHEPWMERPPETISSLSFVPGYRSALQRRNGLWWFGSGMVDLPRSS